MCSAVDRLMRKKSDKASSWFLVNSLSCLSLSPCISITGFCKSVWVVRWASFHAHDRDLKCVIKETRERLKLIYGNCLSAGGEKENNSITSTIMHMRVCCGYLQMRYLWVRFANKIVNGSSHQHEINFNYLQPTCDQLFKTSYFWRFFAYLMMRCIFLYRKVNRRFLNTRRV